MYSSAINNHAYCAVWRNRTWNSTGFTTWPQAD